MLATTTTTTQCCRRRCVLGHRVGLELSMAGVEATVGEGRGCLALGCRGRDSDLLFQTHPLSGRGGAKARENIGKKSRRAGVSPPKKSPETTSKTSHCCHILQYTRHVQINRKRITRKNNTQRDPLR